MTNSDRSRKKKGGLYQRRMLSVHTSSFLGHLDGDAGKENGSSVKMLKSGPVHYMQSATDYLIYNFLAVEGVAPHSHDASDRVNPHKRAAQEEILQ